MPHPCRALVAVVFALACRATLGQVPASPVVFEGFGLGLGDFAAAASAARAVRDADLPAAAGGGLPLDLVVRGPGGGRSAAEPLAAEVRGSIEGVDLAAGVQGDAESLVERTPAWMGRVGVGDMGPEGGGVLEVRTRLESRAGSGRLGVEIGPRVERRLRRGARVFLDGSASAEAIRAADADRWQLPGTSTADSTAAVGFGARAGIVR